MQWMKLVKSRTKKGKKVSFLAREHKKKKEDR